MKVRCTKGYKSKDCKFVKGKIYEIEEYDIDDGLIKSDNDDYEWFIDYKNLEVYPTTAKFELVSEVE